MPKIHGFYPMVEVWRVAMMPDHIHLLLRVGEPTEQTEAYHQEHDRLLRIAEEGTVLVTPGISKGESLMVSDALDDRLPLILLQKEPIGEYWKPQQRRFYACAARHLLILGRLMSTSV